MIRSRCINLFELRVVTVSFRLVAHENDADIDTPLPAREPARAAAKGGEAAAIAAAAAIDVLSFTSSSYIGEILFLRKPSPSGSQANVALLSAGSPKMISTTKKTLP